MLYSNGMLACPWLVYAERVHSLLQSTKKSEPTDEVPRNIYAEPPPLSKTLFGNNDKSQQDPNEPSSFFNQAALTVGSLLLIVVFVVVSGGTDLANFAQPQKPAPQVHSHFRLSAITS